MLLFSTLNKIFCGYSNPETCFTENEINSFRGDIDGTSAQKEALVGAQKVWNLVCVACSLPSSRPLSSLL